MDKLKEYWNFVYEVFEKWGDDKAPKLGAALAYYTVFSLAPLLVIVISVAGLIFGKSAAQGQVVSEMESLIGREAAVLIQTAIINQNESGAGIIAIIIGSVTLIITATATFIELQDSLNIIWRVQIKPGRVIMEFIRVRMVSFAMIIAIGFLLLVSLLITAAISALITFLSEIITFPSILLRLLDLSISLSIIFLLFSLIFKVLPDVKLSWKDVRVGAIVTTILFVIGKYLIGLYLGSSAVGSTFGAAGALALVLVWIYYSSQILFLGAEFTYFYTVKFGSGVKPVKHAVKYEITKVEE